MSRLIDLHEVGIVLHGESVNILGWSLLSSQWEKELVYSGCQVGQKTWAIFCCGMELAPKNMWNLARYSLQSSELGLKEVKQGTLAAGASGARLPVSKCLIMPPSADGASPSASQSVAVASPSLSASGQLVVQCPTLLSITPEHLVVFVNNRFLIKPHFYSTYGCKCM